MICLPGHASVTSAELVRHFGRWQDQAASEPILITHHGRGRVVLLSAGHYQQLVADRAGEDGPISGGDDPDEAISELMDRVAQGFVAFRRDMTISAINRSACGFLKAHRQTVVGRRLDERLPGIEETLGYANLARSIESGTISMLEMPSFAFEGRWLLFETFPWRDGAACLFRDITDEMEARRMTDTKAATLAALAVHGDVGRAKLSTRGTFTDVDAAFAHLAGFAPEGLARARLTDILVPRQRVSTTDAIEAVLEGGAAQQLDVDLLTRSGRERSVRIGLAPLRNHGAPGGAVAVMTTREAHRQA